MNATVDYLRMSDEELGNEWHRAQRAIDRALAAGQKPGPALLLWEDDLLTEFDRRDRERGTGAWATWGGWE